MNQGYTKTVDWWTLGVLLYEMMVCHLPCVTSADTYGYGSSGQTGLPPFYDDDVNVMYQRILSDPLLFPQDMPHDAMTLITGLLQRDPAKRLGANGAEEIKRHPFFSKHVDWNRFAKFLPPVLLQ